MKFFERIKMSKIFLLALIASLLYFFVKSLFKPIQKPAQTPHYKKSPVEPATEMVQDPVCKVFVDPKEALSMEYGGMHYYFCSEACARKFKTQMEQGGVK